MISSYAGLFTTVDLYSAAASYYWRGEKLANVISCMALNSGKQRRVSIRLQDPAKVTPALDINERTRLNAIYAEMRTAGLIVLIGQGV